MSNATQVRSTGYTTSTQNNNTIISGNRCAFTLSNGNALVVILDVNSASSTNGDKTGVTKIYVYESSDRIAWTLRATTTAPVTGVTWTAALYTDNSVGVMISTNNLSATGTRFNKMTYAGYTFGTWETINTGTTVSGYSELVITDTDLPVAVITTLSSDFVTARHEVWIRLSTAVWTLVTSFGSVTSSFNASFAASITALGITSGVRRIAVCTSGVAVGDDGANVRVFKITESTGVISGTVVLAGTFAVNENDATNTSGRVSKLFRSGTDEWTLGLLHFGGNRTFGAARGTYDGTTSTVTVPYTSTSTGLVDTGFKSAGINYGTDCLNFVYTAGQVSGEAKPMLVNFIAKIYRATGSVGLGGNYKMDDYNSLYTTWYVSSGGDRNLTATSRFDTLMIENSTTGNHIARHIYANMSTVVLSVLTPANGATVTSSNPGIGISVSTGLKYGYSRGKIRWQFAKDAAFTTNFIEQIGLDVSPYMKLLDGTDVGGVVRFTDTLSTLYRLAQGTWYIRAALMDEFGNVTPNSTAALFTVSHLPAASNLIPSGGQLFIFGTGARQFNWTFTDPSATDTQTAFEVVVERVDTGLVIYDSGKIVSTATSHTNTFANTAKDLSLRWKVRVWDTDDVVGAYSAYSLFQMSDPATIVFVSPTNNAVLISGRPVVTFTPTITGSRTIIAYQVTITQGNTVIWSSGPVTGSFPSGTSITVNGTRSYLLNNNSYTIQANVTDSLGLVGYAVPINVTTSWVPPAPPAGLIVDASPYDVEGKGYVSITWNDTARDVDFDSWVIYRKDDLIDPVAGTVLYDGGWVEIYRQSLTATTYEYRDILAPSNYKVNYRVKQVANRQGDVIESVNVDLYSVWPISTSYWLVCVATNTLAAYGIRFPIVTGESFTDEYESSEYTVVGRGRHVDMGEHLGFKGSIDARIRGTGGVPARQKRLQLIAIKDSRNPMYLRNPFGDVFRVNVEDISISRIAGVGASEFVDVTIPYGQVSK